MPRTLIGPILGIILVFTVFACLVFLGWHFVKERVLQKQEYLLLADKIVVSPPPDWVPQRFIEDVLRSSGLNKMSLLDKTLPQKLMEAFVIYPWVEKVEQVALSYPSGAEIKLVYRVPAAFVEMTQRGIVAVDRNGVVLPWSLSDASSDQQNNHLIIQGIQSMPLGSAGTLWGDPLVETAAQLAAALTDDDNIVEPLKLKWIIPTLETAPNGDRMVFRLKTIAGTEFNWGTFVPGAPKLDEKKRKLWKLHEDFRSLDRVPENYRDLSKE